MADAILGASPLACNDCGCPLGVDCAWFVATIPHAVRKGAVLCARCVVVQAGHALRLEREAANDGAAIASWAKTSGAT